MVHNHGLNKERHIYENAGLIEVKRSHVPVTA